MIWNDIYRIRSHRSGKDATHTQTIVCTSPTHKSMWQGCLQRWSQSLGSGWLWSCSYSLEPGNSSHIRIIISIKNNIWIIISLKSNIRITLKNGPNRSNSFLWMAYIFYNFCKDTFMVMMKIMLTNYVLCTIPVFPLH